MGHHTFWGFCLLAFVTVSCLVEGSPGIQAGTKCPQGAFYYRLRCYHPVYMPLTWGEAEFECQNLRSGGHLATFQTAAEERIISSVIRRSSSTTDAWIGMYAMQVGKELDWQWSDGTAYTRGSPLWDNRAPSTTTSRPSAECISVTNIRSPGNVARWTQHTCDAALPFVCKYRASSLV